VAVLYLGEKQVEWIHKQRLLPFTVKSIKAGISNTFSPDIQARFVQASNEALQSRKQSALHLDVVDERLSTDIHEYNKCAINENAAAELCTTSSYVDPAA
jgi:hypothetical protein